MQHTHIHTHTNITWRSSRSILPIPKHIIRNVLMVLIGLALIGIFVVVWWTARATTFPADLNNAPSVPQASAPIANQKTDSTDFTQITRNLVASNSPAAFQELVQSLKETTALPQRGILLMALKDASPAIVPVLIIALNDTDAGVRAGAAQLLGMRREYQAIAALTEATRDRNASVRREAITALGAIDAWQVLPRLEQLAVNEPDYDVRQSAIAVKESFKQAMAQAIGVLPPELRDISVTAGDVPQIYAVTTSNLYARHGTAWTLVSRLPDAPLAIAAGSDPNQIYLATVSTGLYRSFDGGETWEYVTFGLQTPTNLTITAIVIDPRDPRHAYSALVSPGAELGIKDPLGISESKDGGATWWALEDSPMNVIITRLVIDPQRQGYLFGMALDSPWRYKLPEDQVCATCPN